MKNLFLLATILLVGGAGCPLVKSTPTQTAPAVPPVRMEQGIKTAVTGTAKVDPKAPVVFAETSLSLISEKKSTKPIGLPGKLPFSLQMQTVKQEWRSPSTTVTREIPKLVYPRKPAKALAFNDLINQKTDQITGDFLQQVADWESDNNNTKLPVAERVNFIAVSVVARTVNAKVLSLVIDINTYYAGSPHPNHNTQSFNYDLEKDQELKLADLFVGGKAFITKLSTEAVAIIKTTPNEKGDLVEYDKTWLEAGAGPKESNYHTVTLAPTGFYIEFDPYDIDSYAAGPVEIFIPYAQLEGYVSARVSELVK